MEFIIDIETKPQENLIKVFGENIKPRSNLKDPDKIALDIEVKKNL